MVSISIPGMYGWSNRHYLWLSGASGLSPSHGGGLGAPFLFGWGVTVIKGQTGQRTGTSLIESFNEAVIMAP